MQLITMLLGRIYLFTLVFATDSTLGLPHKAEVFQYQGSLGGHEVQLNGTVQEIYAQMEVLHPDFNKSAAAIRSDNLDLESRDALNKDGMICYPVPGQSWLPCDAQTIMDGVTYLEGLDKCDIGPTSCVRISCSYNSAIWFCNDNDYGIQPSCSYLSTYATDIVYGCGFIPAFSSMISCGQEFDSDRYNIIVREDSC